MKKIKCPSCGANLALQEDNRECAFCEYCGAKISLDDTYSTHRVVDDARLEKVEAEQTIKHLELTEKQEAEKEKKRQLKMKALIIAGIVSAVSIMIGYIANSNLFFTIGGLTIVCTFFAVKDDDTRRK